jgi:hypothetical protein
MLKKIMCWCLLIIFLIPLPAQANFSDDISQFKQRYSYIYDNIDPALADKMDIFLQDVVDYVVVHYDSTKDISVQIKNSIASVLLTGDEYKNDLLPFMMEQAQNKEEYQTMLSEMMGIVRTEVQARLNAQGPVPAEGGVVAFIQEDAAGVHYEYNYTKLQSDYVKHQMGHNAQLYDDFTADKSTIALKDNVRGYVSYAKVQSAYVKAQMLGTPFDVNEYTATLAELYPMPLSLTKVSLEAGNIIREVVNQ